MDAGGKEAVPARIHVLLARDAPFGVVIRRGPAKHVCTVGWDRRNDSFVLGQWLKGRIYERRSDISPNGRHLIYFAMNGKWGSETGGSWTAISRAPYLKAIGLWAKGDCWHGGGLFITDSRYWINDGYGHEQLRAPMRLTRKKYHPEENVHGGECPGVYYLRLQRDGWTHAGKRETGHSSTDVFEKPVGSRWILRKLAHATVNPPVGSGCYFDEHELVDGQTKWTIDLHAWEWADLDRDRLVGAEGGRLLACRLTDSGPDDLTELYDFNSMKFEAIGAPY